MIPSARDWFTSPRYKSVRDVFWFAMITLAIHYGYRFWSLTLDYYPVAGAMSMIRETLTGWVFTQSSWVTRVLLGIDFETAGRTMTFANGSWICVNTSCAGDKQIVQFMLLLLIYPGVVKHKLWFIPAGMVILHFTNVLRIALLAVVSVNWPQWWHEAHNTVLRGMFYVVILVLWILWTEKFRDRVTRDA